MDLMLSPTSYIVHIHIDHLSIYLSILCRYLVSQNTPLVLIQTLTDSDSLCT